MLPTVTPLLPEGRVVRTRTRVEVARFAQCRQIHTQYFLQLLLRT